MLATFYEMLKEDNEDNIEIIFVSSDKDPESFQEYFGKMVSLVSQWPLGFY